MGTTSLLVFCGALLLNTGTPGHDIVALGARAVPNGRREVLLFAATMWIGKMMWFCKALC